MTVEEMIRRLGQLYPRSEEIAAWTDVYRSALRRYEGESLRAAFEETLSSREKLSPPKPAEILKNMLHDRKGYGLERTDLEQYHWCCTHGMSNGAAFYAEKLRKSGQEPTPLPDGTDTDSSTRSSDATVAAYFKIVDEYPSPQAGWFHLTNLAPDKFNERVAAALGSLTEDEIAAAAPGGYVRAGVQELANTAQATGTRAGKGML